MNTIKNTLSISLIAALLMSATACKSSTNLIHTLVLGLQVVVDGATVAISVVSAADPQGAPALKYAQGISQAASDTIAELGTADTSVQKIDKAIGYFEAVVAPSLPAGTQRVIVVSISSITQAVQLFLTQLHNAKPAMAAALAGGLSPQVDMGSMSHADSVKVKAMLKQAQVNVTAVKP